MAAAWVTAWGKQIRPDDPLASFVWFALAVLVLGVPILSPLLLWAGLRKLVPRLQWWPWLGVMIVAGIAYVLIESWLPSVSEALRSVRRAGLDSVRPSAPGALLHLPWTRLLANSAAQPLIVLLLPACLVARAARVRLVVPVCALLLASSVSAVLEELFAMYGARGMLRADWPSVNGWSWRERLQGSLLHASLAASWAAVAAAVFLGWSASSAGRRMTRVASVAAVAVLVATQAAVFLLRPGGSAVAGAWLARAVTPTPRKDISEGEPLLQHVLDVPLPDPARRVAFAPDGSSFIVATKAGELLRYETATGRRVGTIANGFTADEPLQFDWSADGRWFVVRSGGDVVPVQHYRPQQTRLRAYALPHYRLVGEYRHTQGECLNHSPQSQLLFDPAGDSVWIDCQQFYSPPAVGALMALRLTLPQLAVQAERRYASTPAGHLETFYRVGDAIWSWQRDPGTTRMVVRDLSHDREVVEIRGLTDSAAAGSATLQEVATLSASDLVLRYARWAQKQQDWLHYDVGTGALLERRSEPLPSWQPGLTMWDVKALRIEARTWNDRNTGEVRVLDAASGRERQRLAVPAQTVAGASRDGHWLMMLARDRGRVRIYRLPR